LERTASLPVDPDGYSYDELLTLVGATLRAGLSVLLRGHPGWGRRPSPTRSRLQHGHPRGRHAAL